MELENDFLLEGEKTKQTAAVAVEGLMALGDL